MTETITTAAERDALLMAVGENARAACVEDRYGDTWLIVWRSGAQAVLALLPGWTVDEVWRAAWESCCLRSGVDRDDALDDYLAGGE